MKCMSNRQLQQADEMSHCNLHIRAAMRHTFSPVTTIIQSTLSHSNQALSQIMFDEVARVLSRHHPRPMKNRKIGPECGVVEADVMWEVVVVAPKCVPVAKMPAVVRGQRCRAKLFMCLQCHLECSMFQRCKTSSILET